MQIGGSFNYNRSQLVALESNPATADRTGKQQRLRQANDSYTKNAASAQVIDAEYVDLYASKNQTPPKPQNLDRLLKTVPSETKPDQQLMKQSSAAKYPQQPRETPPPGTYINYFA